MANGRGEEFIAYEEAMEAEAMARRESYEEDVAQEQEATTRTKAAVGLSFEELQAVVYGVQRV